jgi:hypothetical protein
VVDFDLVAVLALGLAATFTLLRAVVLRAVVLLLVLFLTGFRALDAVDLAALLDLVLVLVVVITTSFVDLYRKSINKFFLLLLKHFF